ncbi:hypothetical protein V6N13_048313 [Hibiscus sabdariffa]
MWGQRRYRQPLRKPVVLGRIVANGAFQPYSAMMSAPSHAPGQFFPSPHPFQTSVAPLAVYPPQGPDFNFTYGMM